MRSARTAAPVCAPTVRDQQRQAFGPVPLVKNACLDTTVSVAAASALVAHRLLAVCKEFVLMARLEPARAVATTVMLASLVPSNAQVVSSCLAITTERAIRLQAAATAITQQH